jgi:hypothetical protein
METTNKITKEQALRWGREALIAMLLEFKRLEEKERIFHTQSKPYLDEKIERLLWVMQRLEERD